MKILDENFFNHQSYVYIKVIILNNRNYSFNRDVFYFIDMKDHYYNKHFKQVLDLLFIKEFGYFKGIIDYIKMDQVINILINMD